MEFIEQDNTLRVSFDVQMDSLTCNNIEHDLAVRISEAKVRIPEIKIEFDLSKTEFIGSTFLRFCVLYVKQLGKRKFRVLHPSENVLRVFEISGLIDLIM